ncbi:MAG: hypothetical protein L3K09_07585 [Thermoplasmata archaeon]|nr:hypothetical protein [Thermoplasmata archaeon]
MTSGSPRSAESSRLERVAVSEEALQGIDAHLRQREITRDELFQRARRLRRLAQGTMTRLHEGADVSSGLAEVARELSALSQSLRSEARGEDSIAHDAVQESVEALLLGAVVRGEPLPGPRELEVESEPYLQGLGDLVGEVRRLALTRLSSGDLERAEGYLALMERLYHSLMRFDTTRAIVALKPKQDTARSLLERTRGEVTMARVLERARIPGRSTSAEER